MTTRPAIPVQMNDDAADLAAATHGDHAAFARLFDRHGPVVLSLCRRDCPGEADDALQETFIRAFRMLDRLDGPARFRPWLYAIAKRVCSERRRAASRRARYERDAMTQATAHPPTVLDGEACSERREQFARLEAALDRLDDPERLAVHLYYLDADPIAAARSALGLSRSGYYKLLARAREKLAALLDLRAAAAGQES